MEVRIGHVESDLEHIQADVTELKVGQQRLDTKIDDLGNRLDESNKAHAARFDALEAKIDRFDQRHVDKADSHFRTTLWALGFVLTASAGGSRLGDE